jgi:hypothetical protein
MNQQMIIDWELAWAYTAIRFINLSVFLNPVFDPFRIAVTIKLETSASRPSSVMT